MDHTIPDYLYAIELIVITAMPMTIVLGLWLAARRSNLETAERRATWLVMSAAIAVWFASAWTLGKANAFTVTGADQPTIPFAIFGPIVAGLFLILMSKRASAVVDATPQSWLVGVQVYRALGAMFLLLWFQEKMPGEFAIPAGVGDIIVGVAAPFVAWRNAAAPADAVAVTRAWNVFGIADLAIAVATGFLTAPSVYQALAFDRPNDLITAFPIVMVPAFLVPLSIILHVLSLWKLSRAAATAV